MHAHLRSVRLAPKKANLMAKMIRGMRVPDAVELLSGTSKKSARIFEQLLKSAMANARHNVNQDPQMMVVKTVVVNQGTAYHRGIPMARGRVRPIRKFLSHIEIRLGMRDGQNEAQAKSGEGKTAAPKAEKKSAAGVKVQKRAPAKVAKTTNTTKAKTSSASSSASAPSS